MYAQDKGIFIMMYSLLHAVYVYVTKGPLTLFQRELLWYLWLCGRRRRREREREREAVATYNFNDNWRGGEEEEEGLKYPTITAVPPPEEAEGRRGKKRKVDAKFYDTNECLFNSVSG